MTTEFLREKINVLNNNIQAEAMQQFQSQLMVDVAAKTTGDTQVDQALKAQADNAKAQLLACTRRLETYREKLTELNAELNAAA